LSDQRGRTRREILADAAKAAAAASAAGLAGCFPSVGGKWPPPSPDAGAQCSNPDGGATESSEPPRAVTPAVVEVFREDSLAPGSKTILQPPVIAEMLDAGLLALARQVKMLSSEQAQDGGVADAGEPQDALLDGDLDNPWKVLLPSYQAGQTIGIKVNCLGVVATSPALVRALIASLRDKLGVDPGKIVVWDRYLSDLTGNGKYTSEDLAGARMYGTLTRGVDEEKGENQDDPNFTDGHGYGDTICSVPKGQLESGTGPGRYPRVTRIVTHETALTINCLAFKSHNVSGITGALKSVYGIIDNPGHYHKDFDVVAPPLYAIPAVRKSISLIICDAIRGVLSGPPSGPSNCIPRRILLAQDPVAMDSYIHVLLNQLRAAIGSGPIVPSPDPWLDKAASMGLGTRGYQLVTV
jgi:hypothetical protein